MTPSGSDPNLFLRYFNTQYSVAILGIITLSIFINMEIKMLHYQYSLLLVLKVHLCLKKGFEGLRIEYTSAHLSIEKYSLK